VPQSTSYKTDIIAEATEAVHSQCPVGNTMEKIFIKKTKENVMLAVKYATNTTCSFNSYFNMKGDVYVTLLTRTLGSPH